MSTQSDYPRPGPGSTESVEARFKQIEADLEELNNSRKEDRKELWEAIGKTEKRVSAHERWINIAIGFASAVSLIAGWMWSKLTGDK